MQHCFLLNPWILDVYCTSYVCQFNKSYLRDEFSFRKTKQSSLKKCICCFVRPNKIF